MTLLHPEQPKSFEALREQLLDRLMILMAILFLPSLALDLWRANLLGTLPIHDIRFLFYGLFLLLIWQRRRLPYPWRAGLFLGLWWTSTTVAFAYMGLSSGAKTVLVIISMTAMFLLPARIGWLAVPLSGLTIGAFGVAMFSGVWTLPERALEYHLHPLGWVLTAYHLTALSGVAVFTVWQMVHVLRHSLEQSRQQAAQLHDALARQKAIFATTNAAIGILKERAFVEVNEHLASLLGYGRDELIGQSTRRVHLDDEHYEDFGRRIYPQLKANGHCALEYPFRRKDGSLIWIYLSISALQEEIALVGIDITELRQTREAAEAANQAKSVFLANMSHELRTPLNAVLGYAQILAGAPNLDEAQRRQVTAIRQGGNHLLALINDVLDLAKIEADRIELTPTDWKPRAFFPELIDLLRSRAEEKGIGLGLEIDAQTPALLRCDALRLRQVLMNLLGNAVKFTHQGRVTLKVGYQQGRLRLAVSDSGIGIPQGQIQRIFERFEQVGSAHHNAQGSGLGLAISRRLVERMGGALGVESVAGEGSTFYFEIPVEIAAEQPIPAAPPDAPKGEAPAAAAHAIRRVLVVDDVEINRTLVADLLTPRGFVVEQAANGRDGIELAQRRPPDLILMDLRMPEMDGLETTRALRALGIQTPVAMLSASAFEADRAASLAAGCQDFLSKPIALEALLAAIARIGRGVAARETPAPAIPPSGDETLIDRTLLDGHAAALPPEKFLALLQKFEPQGTETRDALIVALRNHQPDAAQQAAHRLAGMAGMLGLQALSGLCRGIEGDAAAMSPAQMDAIIGRLESLFQATLAALADYVEAFKRQS